MTLLLVSKTLLLLRNNYIPLHQSSNFVLFLLNYPRSRTIFFGVAACILLFVIANTGTADIFSSDCSYISSKTLSVICKDPSLFNNASISFVYFELIVVLLMVYAIYVLFFVQ